MSLFSRFLGKLLGRPDEVDPADVRTIKPPPLPKTRAELVTHHVRVAFAARDYRPPMIPAVALELLQLFRRPDVSLDQVIAVLEKDPMLASEVLQLAQTPAYATKVPARSLPEATRRLGTGALTGLVWETVLHSKVFRCPAYAEAMDRTRNHSLATARMAKEIGKRCRIDRDQCFLTGLLHDIGVAAALLVIGALPERDRLELDIVWDGLAEVHEACSGMVTALWGLPVDIQAVVGFHHPTGRDERGAPPPPVTSVVILAEHLMSAAGLGLGPAFDLHSDEIVELALERLRLAPDDLIELAEEAGIIAAQISGDLETAAA